MCAHTAFVELLNIVTLFFLSLLYATEPGARSLGLLGLFLYTGQIVRLCSPDQLIGFIQPHVFSANVPLIDNGLHAVLLKMNERSD